MQPIKYETWIKLKDWIKTGADVGSGVAAALFSEIPIIGPLIGAGLVKILGWGLDQLLDYLPHENEPRPDSFSWLPLHKPGYQYYVADPNMYGGDVDAARAAQEAAMRKQDISFGNPVKIQEAIDLVNQYNAGKVPMTALGPPRSTSWPIPITPLTPLSLNNKIMDFIHPPVIGVEVYSDSNKGYDPVTAGIIMKKGVNPTWNRAGF